ncbi:hypothetical protein [Flavobacterium chilense]|uniref:Uncharacterized protein n=1 Tax=Flavobacterium chilense TaxID=946677 RepID=A0A1M7H2N8_9FLAO|nr:hypothetical protein [Flavobacterium chilense]SHM22596.1 hypothetical protein SAMN05444484_104433 [Flavobacterium chilense]
MNAIFLLRHWIFTLLLGTIIFSIINGYSANWSSRNFSDFFQLYPFMVIIGLLLSLPTYLLYIFITTVLKNKNIKIVHEKTILIIFVISGVFITTALINGTVWFDLAISYSLSTIIATFFFTMHFKNDKG